MGALFCQALPLSTRHRKKTSHKAGPKCPWGGVLSQTTVGGPSDRRKTATRVWVWDGVGRASCTAALLPAHCKVGRGAVAMETGGLNGWKSWVNWVCFKQEGCPAFTRLCLACVSREGNIIPIVINFPVTRTRVQISAHKNEKWTHGGSRLSGRRQGPHQANLPPGLSLHPL